MPRTDIDWDQRTTDFIRELLRDTLDYPISDDTTAAELGELRYPLSFLAGKVTVLVAPYGQGLDELPAAGGCSMPAAPPGRVAPEPLHLGARRPAPRCGTGPPYPRSKLYQTPGQPSARPWSRAPSASKLTLPSCYA